MRKRIFASLLALVMLLSLLPTTVLAASEDGTDDETPAATVETSDSDADSATPAEPETPEDGDDDSYYETDEVTDPVEEEVRAEEEVPAEGGDTPAANPDPEEPELTAQETPVAENEWGSGYDDQELFEISSVADLMAFATMVNEGKDFNQKTVTLKSNLDLLSVTNWTPIGSVDLFSGDDLEEGDCPFAGTFNGGNYKISNLKISYGINESDPLYDYGGLFGYVTGKVENVTLETVNLKAASERMGGIAGELGNL